MTTSTTSQLPDSELLDLEHRIAQFCGVTGATPPESLVDSDGAPTDDFLNFCAREGANIDWLVCGDVAALGVLHCCKSLGRPKCPML